MLKNVKKFSIKLIFYTIKPCCANVFWKRSKNRVIENRVMENRVKGGITVLNVRLMLESLLNSIVFFFLLYKLGLYLRLSYLWDYTVSIS